MSSEIFTLSFETYSIGRRFPWIAKLHDDLVNAKIRGDIDDAGLIVGLQNKKTQLT